MTFGHNLLTKEHNLWYNKTILSNAINVRAAEEANMNGFAELLQRLRLKAGLSQNALAKKAGVDPSYINRIERSERQPPSLGVIHDIARALELDEFSTNQLLLSAGYAPATTANPQLVTHPRLQLLGDFLSDDSISPEDRDLIERDLDLLGEHIRLIRKHRRYKVGEDTESS